MDSSDVRRMRGDRWLTRVDSFDQAAAHVESLGFVLLFSAERMEAPSLWEAVAGEDVRPFDGGMGHHEARIWQWKDELPQAGRCWYGKFLYRRASLVAPDVLAALYPGRGKESDHASMELSREAHEIAELLRGGPMPTAALRRLVGNRARYERGMSELQQRLLVTSAGVERSGSGWPASIIELTCRLFPVGGGADPAYVARRFLTTMLATSTRDMARALGIPVAVARGQLDALVASGAAERPARDTYLLAQLTSHQGS